MRLELEETGEFECGRFLGFSLEVENLDRFYEASIGKGIVFTGTPEKQCWGGYMTHEIDSSQNTFSIVQIRRRHVEFYSRSKVCIELIVRE